MPEFSFKAKLKNNEVYEFQNQVEDWFDRGEQFMTDMQELKNRFEKAVEKIEAQAEKHSKDH